MGTAAASGMPPGVSAVAGFYVGGEVSFIHTEASSSEVARRLTQMMGSPVVVVPQLARVGRPALADFYIFVNGVRGDGPMGFQPDVFDSAPGERGYSPLRALNLVRWAEGARPRELRSSAAVAAAARRGELRIEWPGVVVNMPFVTWPGGSR